MKKYILASIWIVLWGCGTHLSTDQSTQVHTFTSLQDSLIREKVATFPNQAQLSIAIIENGEVKFSGIKRMEDSTLIVQNQQQVFEIGSITKVFTTTLLANYVEAGKIGLQDPINPHLEFTLKDDIQISFKQLATHTSGLPRIPPSLDSVSLDNPYKDYGEETLSTYLSEQLVMSQNPGEVSEYSNLGVGLLGYVLGEIDDLSYEEMLQKFIFSRYQMEQSTTIRNSIEDKLIIGLNDEGEEVPNWDMAVFMGAGGILSTTEDLAKFALAQFNPDNKELALTRTDFFKVTDSYSMGLGWSIIKTESGAEWNWHNGGTGGYTSSMIMDTKAKNAVIILSNISALGELTAEVMSLSPVLMETLQTNDVYNQ